MPDGQPLRQPDRTVDCSAGPFRQKESAPAILPAHKVAGVIDAIEAAGATAFYLPPYSPDLNPIEQVFSKLKALLRKAAERTFRNSGAEFVRLLRTISDEKCLNYFRHMVQSLRGLVSEVDADHQSGASGGWPF
jgi:hypothetical protein